MDLHEVHSGAINPGGNSYCVTEFHRKNFVVYGCRSNIVILDQSLKKVQVISGEELVASGYVTSSKDHVTAISCDLSGKIAASHGDNVIFIEPQLYTNSDHDLSHDGTGRRLFSWRATDCLKASSHVLSMCFNSAGTRLVVTGTTSIQLWISPDSSSDEDWLKTDSKAKFSATETPEEWSCVWSHPSVTPVILSCFSSDERFLATLGKDECFVKVWYERRVTEVCDEDAQTTRKACRQRLVYDNILLSHPKHVTGFQWRKTSKYITKAAVANAMITWCQDAICRVWCESKTPPTEDWINNRTVSDFYSHSVMDNESWGDTEDSKDFQVKLWPTGGHVGGGILYVKSKSIWSSPSDNETNDVKLTNWKPHTFGYNMEHHDQSLPRRARLYENENWSRKGGTAQKRPSISSEVKQPPLRSKRFIKGYSHFHMATSFKADGVPPGSYENIVGVESLHGVRVHWLNNKKLEFSTEVEKFLEQLHLKSFQARDTPSATEAPDTSSGTLNRKSEDGVKKKSGIWKRRNQSFHLGTSQTNRSSSPAKRRFNSIWKSRSELFRKTMESTRNEEQNLVDVVHELLKEWADNADMLFAFHPVTGKLLLWKLEHLEAHSRGAVRQATITPLSLSYPLSIPPQHASSIIQLVFPVCEILKLEWESQTRKHSDGCDTTIDASSTVLSNGDCDVFKLDLSSESRADRRASEGQVSCSSTSSMPIMAAMPSSSSAVPLSSAHTEPGKDQTGEAQPLISLLTVHKHGGLAAWGVTFSHSSKYSELNSIELIGKIGGHRFQVTEALAHPTLPLLITTGSSTNILKGSSPHSDNRGSELIVWTTSSVGYLSRKDALAELTRMTSVNPQAYICIAWVPALKQGLDVDEAALFIVSDGTSVEIYRVTLESDGASVGSHCPVNHLTQLAVLKEDFCETKQEMLLLHAFTSTMIATNLSSRTNEALSATPISKKTLIGPPASDVIYVVAIVTTKDRTVVAYTWKLQLKLKVKKKKSGTAQDSNVEIAQNRNEENSIRVKVSKVCKQILPVSDTQVISAKVSIGQAALSSVSLLVPPSYHVTTAHSDGSIRFWICRSTPVKDFVEWVEWRNGVSTQRSLNRLEVEGEILHMANLACGELAIACKSVETPVETKQGGNYAGRFKKDLKIIQQGGEESYSVTVLIYECESTGGQEWACQTKINLGSISDYWESSGQTFNKQSEALNNSSSCVTFTVPKRQKEPTKVKTNFYLDDDEMNDEGTAELEASSSAVTAREPNVHVEWMSDGCRSRVLTIVLGNVIMVYTTDQFDHWSQIRRFSLSPSADRLPGTVSSIAWVSMGLLIVGQASEIRVYSQWPSKSSAVEGDGSAVDGYVSDTEDYYTGSSSSFAVTEQYQPYSYLKNKREGFLKKSSLLESQNSTGPIKKSATVSDFTRNENFESNAKLGNASAGRIFLPRTSSVTALAHIANSVKLLGDKKNEGRNHKRQEKIVEEAVEIQSSHGLFEEIRKQNLPLPQYHPKQLLELFLLGKINRVKAILIHVLRCIEADESVSTSLVTRRKETGNRRASVRQRRMSAWGPAGPKEAPGGIPEEDRSDGPSVANVPPLPLYAVLAADEGGLVATFQSGIEPTSCEMAPEDGAAQGVYNSLFDGNNGTANNSDSDIDYAEDDDNDDDAFTSLQDNGDGRNDQPHRQKAHSTNWNEFGPDQAMSLTRYLVQTRLPRLSGLEQMHLMALADTIANGGSWGMDGAKSKPQKMGDSDDVTKPVGQVRQSTQVLDDCGRRFLMSQWRYIYLLNTLPYKERYLLQQQGLSSSQFVWAFHSDSQQSLLESIYEMKANPTWVELRQFGVGWWLTDAGAVRDCIEKLAKTEYQVNNDAMDVLIYYVALKKLPVLAGLFKISDNTKMMEFFKNNFKEDRWIVAAKKNAYSLMGKHRYTHAAAFFLLAGSLKDCLQVCISNLKDVQLALILSRLQEPDDRICPCRTSLLQDLVKQRPPSAPGEVPDYLDRLCADAFRRSMALWSLREYVAARVTLLQSYEHKTDNYLQKSSDVNHQTSPHDLLIVESGCVFNLYSYLSTNPLLVKQQSQIKPLPNKTKLDQLDVSNHGTSLGKGGRLNLFGEATSFPSSTSNPYTTDNATLTGLECSPTMTCHESKALSSPCHMSHFDELTVARLERRMHFSTAYAYLQSGYPMLALEVLQNLPENDLSDPMESEVYESSDSLRLRNDTEGKNSSAEVDRSGLNKSDADNLSSAVAERAEDFDWGASNLSTMTDEIPTFQIDDYDSGSNEDDDNDVKETKEKEDMKSNVQINKLDEVNNNSNSTADSISSLKYKDTTSNGKLPGRKVASSSEQDDSMANQLKFSACWAIIQEELSSLATGFDVRGGQLRYHLCVWLEKVVDVLKVFCNYEAGDVTESQQTQDNEKPLSSSTPDIFKVSPASGSGAVQSKRKLSVVVNVNPILAPDTLLSRRFSTSVAESSLFLRPDQGAFRRKSSVFLEPVLLEFDGACITLPMRSRHISDMRKSTDTLPTISECDTMTLRSNAVSESNLVIKMDLLSRRASWIRSHAPLIRTLLSSTILQEGSGSETGLSSIQLELSLLLQEIHRRELCVTLERVLPLPTELPLLMSCLSGRSPSHTDPLSFIEDQMQDILDSVIQIHDAPGVQTEIATIYRLRDLSVSLSRCIYQSLSATDDDVTMSRMRSVGMEGFSVPVGREGGRRLINGPRHLSIKRQSMAAVRDLKKFQEHQTSKLSYWKGISNLQKYLLETSCGEVNPAFFQNSPTRERHISGTLLSKSHSATRVNVGDESETVLPVSNDAKRSKFKWRRGSTTSSTDQETAKEIIFSRPNSGKSVGIRTAASEALLGGSPKSRPISPLTRRASTSDAVSTDDLVALVNSSSYMSISDSTTDFSASMDFKSSSPTLFSPNGIVKSSRSRSSITINSAGISSVTTLAANPASPATAAAAAAGTSAAGTAADSAISKKIDAGMNPALAAAAITAAEDLKYLPHLLMSSLLAVYCGLVAESLALYDARALYRLIGNPPSASIWPILFGDFTWEDGRGASFRHYEAAYESNACRGVYLPPTLSMINFFMTKPYGALCDKEDFDSDASDTESLRENNIIDDLPENDEHINPDSFSWTMMRVAIVKFVRENVENLLQQLDLDINELTSRYHSVRSLLESLNRWSHELERKVETPSLTLPIDYIERLEAAVGGSANLKQSTKRELLLDPCNTPFREDSSARSAKRLWLYLLEHDNIQRFFIEHIFRHIDTEASTGVTLRRHVTMQGNEEARKSTETESGKILFKAHEPVWAFCINQTSHAQIAVATNSELYEINTAKYIPSTVHIKPSKSSVKESKSKTKRVLSQIEDSGSPVEMRETKKKGLSRIRSIPASFSPFHVPKSSRLSSNGLSSIAESSSTSSSGELEVNPMNGASDLFVSQGLVGQRLKGVRKMASHPQSNCYIAGNIDGEIGLWYYGRMRTDSVIKCPVEKPTKINCLKFSQQGNKFAAGYDDGSLSLWTTSMISSSVEPYLTLQCHSKGVVDFTFIKHKTSLLCTAGQLPNHSTSGYQISLWDTLLPSAHSFIQGYSCHPDGIVGFCYLGSRPLVVSAGRGGEVSIMDMRNIGEPIVCFQAHTSPIRCITVDHSEKLLVTGSQDGNIKVWDISRGKSVCAWSGAHARSTPALRSPVSGVNQLYIDMGSALYSSGCDGQLKLHQLSAI